MLALLTSCFGDQKNTLNYTLQATFDWNLEAPNVKDVFKDSLFVGYTDKEQFKGMGWNDFAFCFNTDAENNISGGCIASYSRDYIAYDQITPETTFPKYWSVYEDKTYKEPDKKPESKADGDSDADKTPDRKLLPPNGVILFHANPSEDQMPKHDVVFINTQFGSATMVGCVINNTAQNVAFLKNTFQKGDYIKVIAKGFREEKETGRAEIFLAEFNDERSYVLKEWTKLDLAALGDIDYLDFEWESNRTDVPPYFCFDYMTSNIALSY